jgi:hypothetical protein
MSARFKDPLVWFAGLLAAFLSGGASSAAAGISANLIAPGQFDLHYNWRNTLALMGTTFLISGLLGFFQKLSKSPLPDIVTEETVTTRKESVDGQAPTITRTEEVTTTTK